MSRVNQVKKVLRDRGVEMDVDDVLQALRANPHYRTGLSRNQVAGSLADLHSTDPDIIRTRRGLYRYVDACQASIVPPPAAEQWTPPRSRPMPAAAHAPDPLLVIELDHLRAHVTELLGDASAIDDATLVDHATHLAERQLGSPPRVVTCSTAKAVIVTVVGALAEPAPIMLIASEPTTGIAGTLAAHLDTTIAVLTLPCVGTPAALTRPIPVLVELPPVSDRQSALRAASSLAVLSELDHSGFRRPLRYAGKGSRRDFRRRAKCIGAGYAARWWSVVTDDDRDQLITWADSHPDLPDELHLDLLLFAEHHALPRPDELDQDLCCGFWGAVRERRPLLAADRNSAAAHQHHQPIAS